jgi:hypothetical protein
MTYGKRTSFHRFSRKTRLLRHINPESLLEDEVVERPCCCDIYRTSQRSLLNGHLYLKVSFCTLAYTGDQILSSPI